MKRTFFVALLSVALADPADAVKKGKQVPSHGEQRGSKPRPFIDVRAHLPGGRPSRKKAAAIPTPGKEEVLPEEGGQPASERSPVTRSRFEGDPRLQRYVDSLRGRPIPKKRVPGPDRKRTEELPPDTPVFPVLHPKPVPVRPGMPEAVPLPFQVPAPRPASAGGEPVPVPMPTPVMAESVTLSDPAPVLYASFTLPKVDVDEAAFLAHNPGLVVRYATSQKLVGIELNEEQLARRSKWFKSVLRLSRLGKEAYSWDPALPKDFGLRAFFLQNPALAEVFAKEKGLEGKALTDAQLRERTAWVQEVAKLSLQGQEAGYCWMPKVPQGFNWREALEANGGAVMKRFKRAQLAKTAKAQGDGTFDPAVHLVEGHFDENGFLRADSGFMGMLAKWVQSIKRRKEI